MPASPEGPGSKRRRVFKACQTCRLMKCKCDGVHPSCGRCVGYGYKCLYSEAGRKMRKYDLQEDEDTYDRTGVTTLRSALQEYERLVKEITPKLSEVDRSEVLGIVNSINGRIHDAHRGPIREEPEHLTISEAPRLLPRAPVPSAQRYLGEVSDVSFFNLVDRVLQQKQDLDHHDEALDSYEQDDPAPCTSGNNNNLISLPRTEVADGYLEIYFSTIHIAYPYIPKSTFLKTYVKFRQSEGKGEFDKAWIATLYIIFAIGAYYTSFPGKTKEPLHEQYFQHAVALSNSETLERSINQVSFLLAKCFYLLAVCRTDKCWTTLGLAVRIAQSLGLHVDSEGPKCAGGKIWLRAEIRRRIWYSIYVLDRLLSLQLGRPPAIHDDDCHLPLPSNVGDEEVDWDSEDAPFPIGETPPIGDYFLSVIALSRIIGFVLRDLYSPRREKVGADWLASTKSLDCQLLKWKRSLPRTLRFDFGHTFETSLTFKRQRNMLAIKFHHLRALIYRPYLCLPLLRHLDEASMTSLQGDFGLISQYESACVSEAQATAHLLHNIVDEKDLVHDFPWWQMISCLICASSILLVASVFPSRLAPDGDHLDVMALEDDAETCLKVFEALSAKSDGARIARDMMKRLKERGQIWKSADGQTDFQPPLKTVSNGQVAHHLNPAIHPHDDASLSEQLLMEYEGGAYGTQEWPSEIIDTMAWSAQFFSTVDNMGNV